MPLDVKKGDRILFGKWSGTEVKIDGQELLIMKESDILGDHRGKSVGAGRGLIARLLGPLLGLFSPVKAGNPRARPAAPAAHA